MSAQPVQEHDQDDPVVILRVLPERFHEQLLGACTAGYCEPGFEGRLGRLREAV